MAKNMIAPLPHKEEDKRLRELYSYDILDTLPEEDFDVLTRLAGQIAGTPITLISLIDMNRQWFKSQQGLDGATETPRDESFCGHAINIDETEDVFVIPDARKDERFKDNPNVTGNLNVVFYAGIPLRTSKGLPLGTLCVIDNQPKSLSDDQIAGLKDLARQVMNTMELRKKTQQLHRAMKIIEEQNVELQSFAANAAHDLKSPLANIQSLSLILEQELESGNKKESLEVNQFIRQSADSLLELLQHMLDEIRGTAKEEEKDQLVSCGELREIVNHLYAGDPDLSISFELNSDCIPLPHLALKRLMINLISNAVKHNDKPVARIHISSADRNDRTYIAIEDNGPGIPEEKRDRIFDLFETLNDTDRYGKKSHGMGLNFVKQITEEFGGEIQIQESVLGGVRFHLSFPRPKNEEAYISTAASFG